MPFFTNIETYVREVWSEKPPDEKKGTPGKGEKATVTLRRLNAGDQAAIQDTLRMGIGEGADATPALGTMRMLTVQKSLVDWTLPGPKPSPEAISQLDPEVFDQIYAHCEIGTPPTDQQEKPSPQDGETPEATEPTPRVELTPASSS